MVKVIARKCGFYGGKIREIGEEFELVDAHWHDEKHRPSWVEILGDAPQEKSKAAPAKKAKKAKKQEDGVRVEDEDDVSPPKAQT